MYYGNYYLHCVVSIALIVSYYIYSTVPSGAPRNITGTPGDAREILLHWEPPFPENRNGMIIGYVVNATRMNSGEILQLMSTPNSITVSSLSPFTIYICAIAATTSVGSGPFSDEIAVQTLEEGISPFIVLYEYTLKKICNCGSPV